MDKILTWKKFCADKPYHLCFKNIFFYPTMNARLCHCSIYHMKGPSHLSPNLRLIGQCCLLWPRRTRTVTWNFPRISITGIMPERLNPRTEWKIDEMTWPFFEALFKLKSIIMGKSTNVLLIYFQGSLEIKFINAETMRLF